MAVQGAGDEFLAGAGGALDHHRDVRLRQAANGAEYLLHGRRLADDLRPRQRRWFRIAAAFRPPQDGPAHGGHGVVHVEGLGQVFEGAGLVGAYGAVEIRVRRHDDHRQARVAFRQGGQQR